MKRYITLPNGRKCGLGVYVAAWRTLKGTPPETRIKGFGDFPESAAYVLQELRAGMHDRINKTLPWYGRGRKWSHDWQRAAKQCAYAVNTPRLVVRWIPACFRKRLAHRVTTDF